jgi:hypothetical protein
MPWPIQNPMDRRIHPIQALRPFQALAKLGTGMSSVTWVFAIFVTSQILGLQSTHAGELPPLLDEFEINEAELEAQSLRLPMNAPATLDPAQVESFLTYSDEVAGAPCAAVHNPDARQWQALPDGLIWKNYLADPHESRMSLLLFENLDKGRFWDATLGGRVGLLRYGTLGAIDPRGWQWDLEGAVITRLDMEESQDVESMDFRFGTQMTWSEGAWATKFGYFHISSHIGDEYLLRVPGADRVNYVTESAVVATSYRPIQPIRLYGELAYAFVTSGGAEPLQVQTGIEYNPRPAPGKKLAPFVAANLNFREAVDYDVSSTIQAGWSFRGPRSDRQYRFGAQYGAGPTSQYEFYFRKEEYIGIGMWFDY